jgi:hypothetical protein
MQNELVFKRKNLVILVLIFLFFKKDKTLKFWFSMDVVCLVNEDSLSRDRSKNFHY